MLHVTVMCAPDKFPVRDFLPPEDQLTLDSAFEELNRGLHHLEKAIANQDSMPRIRALLDESLSLYKKGEKIQGAHLLQDLEDMLYGKPSYRP